MCWCPSCMAGRVAEQVQSRAYVTQVLADSRHLSFYIDGAHTPESMVSCARWFTEIINLKVLCLAAADHAAACLPWSGTVCMAAESP